MSDAYTGCEMSVVNSDHMLKNVLRGFDALVSDNFMTSSLH